MLGVGDKVFLDNNMGGDPYYVIGRANKDAVYVQHRDSADTRTTYYATKIGTAIGTGLGVWENRAFKLKDIEHSPIYIFNKDGLFEWTGNMWKEISHILHTTLLWGSYLKGKGNYKYVANPNGNQDKMACGWAIGDKVRGLRYNDYSITNERMLCGTIVAITDREKNIFKVYVDQHRNTYNIGSCHQVNVFSSSGEYNFELITEE